MQQTLSKLKQAEYLALESARVFEDLSARLILRHTSVLFQFL